MRAMQRDFTTDETLAFLGTLKQASVLPEWLDQVPDAQEVEGLPSSAFADTGNRLLPIHSKAAAWLSAVSSYAYSTPSGAWADRLKNACHAYGIVDSVKSAIEVLRPAEQTNQKEASTGSQKEYALILNTPEGRSELYPINDDYEIEKSAREILKDVKEKRFPEGWMAKASTTLCKAADDRRIPDYLIPQDVRDLGTPRIPSPERIDLEIQNRVRAGLPKAATEFYKKAADMLCAGEVDLGEAALVWELADRKFGLEGKCASAVRSLNSGIPMAMIEKQAKEVVVFRGELLPLAALQTLSPIQVAARMTKEAAAAVLKCAQQVDGRNVSRILSTLDENQCRILTDILCDAHAA